MGRRGQQKGWTCLGQRAHGHGQRQLNSQTPACCRTRAILRWDQSLAPNLTTKIISMNPDFQPELRPLPGVFATGSQFGNNHPPPRICKACPRRPPLPGLLMRHQGHARDLRGAAGPEMRAILARPRAPCFPASALILAPLTHSCFFAFEAFSTTGEIELLGGGRPQLKALRVECSMATAVLPPSIELLNHSSGVPPHSPSGESTVNSIISSAPSSILGSGAGHTHGPGQALLRPKIAAPPRRRR